MNGRDTGGEYDMDYRVLPEHSIFIYLPDLDGVPCNIAMLLLVKIFYPLNQEEKGEGRLNHAAWCFDGLFYDPPRNLITTSCVPCT